MKSWYTRSREYHSQNRQSVDGSSISYTGTRSASPDEFHSPHQSTLAPSISSYSDHYRSQQRGGVPWSRPYHGGVKAVAREQSRPAPHAAAAVPASQRERVSCDVKRREEVPARTPAIASASTGDAESQPVSSPVVRSSPLSSTPADDGASWPRSDVEWARGVRTAAEVSLAHAMWEREKASLVHSRDSLEVSLQRERCMRGELEDQVRLMRAENQSLKSSLATAIGSPLRRHQQTTDCSISSGSPDRLAQARREQELLAILRDYDNMLRDLQQLQQSSRSAQAFAHYPITLHDTRAFGLESCAALTAIPTEVPARDEAPQSQPPPFRTETDTEQNTPRLLSPPRPDADKTQDARDEQQQQPSSSATSVLAVPRDPGCLSLSPPPPFMRSATRSPLQERRLLTSPWRGPMHASQAGAPGGSATDAESGVGDGEVSVARPLYRSAPTALEREETILETDKLVLALAAELTRLADEHDARDASAVAALCAARGLDYVDAQFPPVTTSLGPGGCRAFVPDTGRDHTVQFQHVTALVPAARGRRAELMSSAGVDPNAVEVGPLNDRGVAAGLAALAEASGAVASILASTTADDEEHGLVRVWVCAGGVWTLVDVDVYVPVLQNGATDSSSSLPSSSVSLYGCASSFTFDLWPAMCEKALAKVLGSYRATAGLDASSTLGLLTGGPVELWDWWRDRLDVAFDEIEAAINTTTRGSGVVLLTTHSTLSTHALVPRRAADDASSASAAPTGTTAAAAADGSETGLAPVMQAAGLSPSTSYRVLAATEDETGQRMLLLRIWDAAQKDALADAHRATTTATPRHRRLSPLRGDSLSSADSHLHDAGVAAHGDGDTCIWLPLHRDVATLFEQCHVCFDCRRFHDVRIPVAFRGSDPCSPACVLRVDVRRPHRDRSARSGATPAPSQQQQQHRPARLWIGLHQPLSRDQAVSSSSLDYSGLKMALLVPELEDGHLDSQHRRSLSAALSGPPTYSVSESFGGHAQMRPSVWMYVEMETFESSTVTFYIIPQLDVSNDQNITPYRSVKDATDAAMARLSTAQSGQRTAVVALLAEERDLFDVQLLSAPSELPAALCHGGLDHLDMSTCEPYPESGRSRGDDDDDDAPRQAQVNGRWVRHFSW